MTSEAPSAPPGVVFTLPPDVAERVADDVFRANLPEIFDGKTLARYFGRPGRPASPESVRRHLRRLGFRGAPGRRVAIQRDLLLRRIAAEAAA